MMSRQTPRASGCTSTLRSPASVGLVVSALAAAGGVSKPTLEMSRPRPRTSLRPRESHPRVIPD